MRNDGTKLLVLPQYPHKLIILFAIKDTFIFFCIVYFGFSTNDLLVRQNSTRTGFLVLSSVMLLGTRPASLKH